jgi:hypothetical protein
LADHQVLTTEQITAIAFVNLGTARNRLARLRQLGVVDRFRHHPRNRPAVTCWVPGLLAIRQAALAAGEPAPTPRAARVRQDRIMMNPQLNHLLGVNQFFTDLIAATRTDNGADPCRRLVRWWSSDRTAAAFAGRVHPDGHGLWHDSSCDHRDEGANIAADTVSADAGARDGSLVGFWLEHDTGTEPLPRLVAKLDAYARLHQAGGPSYPVLFWLPSGRREAHLHDLLTSTRPRDVTVATATHTNGSGTATAPGDAVWWLAGKPPAARHRLEALPCRHVPTGPLNPDPCLDIQVGQIGQGDEGDAEQ